MTAVANRSSTVPVPHAADKTQTVRGPHSLLITGAAGFCGQHLLRELVRERRTLETIVALDVRSVAEEDRLEGVAYVTGDIRSRTRLEAILREHAVDAICHLAFVVAPGCPREKAYAIDVGGTKAVLQAAIATGVQSIAVLSSGAAYGFHPDTPKWVDEETPLRGNQRFAYAYHKRLVEELLARFRDEHPELKQLVLRPGAILGAKARTPVTEPFHKSVVVGVRGSDAPFTFIWVEDVARALAKAIFERATGTYNLAGDGAMTLPEVAAYLGKRYVAVPPRLLKAGLRLLGRLGLVPYGPEHADFLRYRPILINDALKERFGYVPHMTTRECLAAYWRSFGHDV